MPIIWRVMMPRAKSKPRQVNCQLCRTVFFTRHSQGKYCSAKCTRDGKRRSWRKFHAANAETRNKYRREIYKKRRKAVLERTRLYQQSEAGKRARKISNIRMRAKFPERYAARQALNVAVRSGRLIKKPCEKCGKKKVHGHHPDYSKPLKVTWLCEKHHREEHAK